MSTRATSYEVAAEAATSKDVPRLLLLTDRSQLPLGRSLLVTLADCVRAGATAVVVRELDLADSQRDALAAELSALGATVIAAHRPLPHAAGLHLPSAAGLSSLSAPYSACEATITPRYNEFGRSCHSRAEVEAAAREGASWATLSPYAVSASKPGYGPPLPSVEFDGHPIPVYALGGVDATNAAGARRAGAHGVAVMGAVMRAADPADEVSRLLEAVEE